MFHTVVASFGYNDVLAFNLVVDALLTLQNLLDYGREVGIGCRHRYLSLGVDIGR